MRQDLDLATRLTDESENLAKAKACALADWLGREKGFENAGKNFRRHSNARVLDGQHYIIAGLRLPDFMVLKISLPGGDGERSLAVHGVPGIDGKIQHGVFKLMAVDPYLPALRPGDRFDADLVADGAVDPFDHAMNQSVRIKTFGPQRDRTRVVAGKSVSVRVGTGGCRRVKKK